MKIKHQVFICSTFIDLKKERQKLFIELYKNGFIPVGMEGFTPANRGQLQYIKDRIDECDYFVVLVAHRYGTESPDATAGESITEYEYNYALVKGNIPISRFVITDSASWPGDEKFRSLGRDRDRLIKFKARLAKTDRDIFSINPWQDGGDLVRQVLTAVNAMRTEEPRPGLIRPTPPLPISGDASRFGIDRLYSGLRDVGKSAFIEHSQHLWIVLNDGYNLFDLNHKHIFAALQAGCAVRVLLVHPDSPCLPAIADKSNKSIDWQRGDILKTIKFLFAKFGGFSNFKLLGHRQFNTYCALINETECLVDFYFNFRLEHKRQDDRIAMHCSKNDGEDPLYRRVSDDFESFWRETEHRGNADLKEFA